MNITFIRHGKHITVQAQKDNMFAEIVNKYCSKTQITEKDGPKFYFAGAEIPGSSCKTLEELGISDMCRIDVVLTKDLEAAFSF